MDPATEDTIWEPNEGPQTTFLDASERRVLYGGAAGGGKSAGLLACPLYWVGNPNYRGLYLRREASYLGEAVDKSKRIYSTVGGRLVMSPHPMWTFPSGATLWLNHCEHESDIANYDSFEFSELLWDELTHFTEKMFTGICARLRGTDPTLPYWARAATNPGGIGHEWVKARWGPWLDKQHPTPAKPGETRWRLGDKWVPVGTKHALSYTFIPARLCDNPHVAEEYVANLMDLDPVRQAQLLGGDWDATYGEGSMFHRDWWTYLDSAPTTVRRVRGWDLGAGGDATVGVLLGDCGSKVVPRWVVLDVIRHVGPPHEVHALLRSTAEADGDDVTQCVPQDPGQAGKDQAQTFTRELSGFTVSSRPVTGAKIVRAGPASSQAGARNFALVRGPWTPAYVARMHAFPEAKDDDEVDATSEGFARLSRGGGWAEAMEGLLCGD